MTQGLIKQQGLALPTLMVMLSVASLAALVALRNLWVNDQLLNAEADQIRTQQQAEAALPVAVQDIVGLRTSSLRHMAGDATDTHVFFPNNLSEYNILVQRLGTASCQAGICAPASTSAATTHQASQWKAQTQTAIAIGDTDSPFDTHPARYWVELFQEENTGDFVYRITALAQGVSAGNVSVVQAIWKRNSATSLTGQWFSWHVLRD